MINLFKYLVLVVVFVRGSNACCCAETASVFPRVELNTEQMNSLIILADYLESLPCEERTECIYNMTQSPIQLTDAQLVGIAQRFSGSFQSPSDVGECVEPEKPRTHTGEEQPRGRKRRATGTPVCRASVENNQLLYMAYNRNGQLVYIPQPTPGNGFQMSQFFYESICLDSACDGPRDGCSCSTEMIPSSTCVVIVIRGNTNTFTEQTIMTRSCQAFN